MRGVPSNHTRILFVDSLIFLFCMMGVYSFLNKADLPIKTIKKEGEQVIETSLENRNIFRPGDVIFSLEDILVDSREEIEILLDARNPGDDVNLSVIRNGNILSGKLTLINFYSPFYVAVAIIVGISFFLVAIFVFLRCEKYQLGKTFHWSFVFTSMIILMTWGNYSILPMNLGLVTRTGFHLGYLFAPLYFLKFSFIFPSHIKLNTDKAVAILTISAFLLFMALSISFYWYSQVSELGAMRAYVLIFDVSSVFIVLVTLTAIAVFIHTYTTTKNESDRKKLRWIILGFLIGPLSYMIFWVIPSRIWNRPILPEEVVLLLVAFVPITFGISIIKYRLMNIDLIFKRSIVYTIVISFLVIVYVGIVSIAAKLINNPDSELASIIAAVLIAVIFQPAKTKVQKVVDKRFFRISYDYRKALNKFIESTRNIFKEQELLKSAVELIDEIIPVTNIRIYKYYDEKQMLVSLLQKTSQAGKENGNIPVQNFVPPGSVPISSEKFVETGIEVDEKYFKYYESLNSSIVFGIISPNYGIHAILLLGEKKSGHKFSSEDIDLIKTITTRLSLSLDRIKLQEEVLKEHMETERLEELNRLKSFFVSSVSHDLKTPLTSIKLFAERLKSSENLNEKKVNEYLEIIEGESDRLTRLINNVLDYSKIEQGTQKYNLEKIDLIDITKKVLQSLQYQFNMNQFKVETSFQSEPLFIMADADSISEALVNIISNAMKYSREERRIIISADVNKQFAVINIEDCGEGIAGDEMDKVFDPFYRISNEKIGKSGGAGLGLAIVKHIMDGHNGRVLVESVLGEGSKFSLLFPRVR